MFVTVGRKAGADAQSFTLRMAPADGSPPRDVPIQLRTPLRPEIVALLPDGRHMLMAAGIAGIEGRRLFLLPLEGGPPRVYDNPVVRVNPAGILAPDGRHVIIASEEPPVTRLFELDVTDLFRSMRDR
jgi:hypothetical protein